MTSVVVDDEGTVLQALIKTTRPPTIARHLKRVKNINTVSNFFTTYTSINERPFL